jgi:hypothetical protein
MSRRRKEADNGILIFKERSGEQMSLFEGDAHEVYFEKRVILDKKKLLRRLNKDEGKL